MPAAREEKGRPFHVLIAGCGLGGLACAIGCRREGLDVTVLEQGAELTEVGAGIQLPPNAARVMSQFEMMDQLINEGRAVCVENNLYSRYTDGEPIALRPGSAWSVKMFGHAWYTIHRADYRRILAEEAIRLGADIRFGSQVVEVDCERTSVRLEDGTVMDADVVIGADGLNSIVRTHVLGKHLEPLETGDLAYRATIPKEHVESLDNPKLRAMLSPTTHKVGDQKSGSDGAIDRCRVVQVWWGPDRHAVLYAVRGGDVYNLVLAVPDDLPPAVTKVPGNVEQMRKLFEGWDPRLQALIAEVPSSLKWKLVNFKALETWTKGSVCLLGDSCHPTLPYQAQGAAMAVEDGACVAKLLGLAARADANVPEVLKLYESLRKHRTTLNVEGANGNRKLYHASGEAAEERDRLLQGFDWWDPETTSPYKGFNDMQYQRALLGFDTVADAEAAFHRTFAAGGR